MTQEQNERLKRKFWALVARYNALGRLLPSEEDVADGEHLDDAHVILAEMTKVKSEIDATLAEARTRGPVVA